MRAQAEQSVLTNHVPGVDLAAWCKQSFLLCTSLADIESREEIAGSNTSRIRCITFLPRSYLVCEEATRLDANRLILEMAAGSGVSKHSTNMRRQFGCLAQSWKSLLRGGWRDMVNYEASEALRRRYREATIT